MTTSNRAAWWWFAAVVSAAVIAGAGGCGGGESGAEDGGGGSEQADGSGDASGGASGGAGTGAAPAAEPGTTRETASGTMRMWVDAMAASDYESVNAVVDPDSLGYPDVQKMLEIDAELASKPEDQQAGADQIRQMMAGFFAAPFEQASFREVAQDGDRAQFELTLGDERSMDISLHRVDGTWFVLAPEGLFESVGQNRTLPSLPGMPAPAGTAPGGGAS